MLLHRELPHTLKERCLMEGLDDMWTSHTEKSSNIKESLTVENLIAGLHLVKKTQYNCLTATRVTEMTVPQREPQLWASFLSMAPYFLLPSSSPHSIHHNSFNK